MHELQSSAAMNYDSRSPDTLPGLKVAGFPAIHEDELLYSIVVRYGAMIGYADARFANLDLFGRVYGHAAVRLPVNLDTMAMRLPAEFGMTGRDLALRHTLLPYHCAFLPEAAVERAISIALADGDRIGRPVGSGEKPLLKPKRLRFCPECFLDMGVKDFDAYWKRIHQLAIVALCPDHGCDLYESDAAPGPYERQMRLADLALCRSSRSPVIPAGANVDRPELLRLAREARDLLEGQYPAGMSRRTGAKYAQFFRDLGYGYGRGIDWTKIKPAVEVAIADILPAFPRFAGGAESQWFKLSLKGAPRGHTDRVLIAAMILRRIEIIEPCFWMVLSELTGEPLMSLNEAA